MRSAELAYKVNNTFAKYSSRFSVAITSDLSKRELYEPAFANTPKNIAGVIHAASPFKLTVTDVVGKLLDPALGGAIGAISALEATHQYGSSVRRFVYTSSFVAILDITQGLRPGYTYSEKDWNPMTREQAIQMGGLAAYCASKALTERAVWDWMEAEEPPFTLTSINPPSTFGPHLTPIVDLTNLNVSSAIFL